MTNKKEEIGKSEGIKVVDRRRVDAEGKDMEQGQSDNSKSTSSAKVKGEDRKPGTPKSQQEGSSPEIDFSSFIMSFATQALMQLGEISPPPGMEIPKDVNAAKQTIDILSMLQIKTKGNLDPREDSLMEEILHNLRITYVKVSKGSN